MTVPSTPGRGGSFLSQAQEAELVVNWQRHGDEKARERLLTSHLPLVLRAAGQFRGYGLASDDLIAEGNFGLVRALDSFDVERGLRFATYAQWWVRAAMYDHVLRFSTPVSFPITADRKRVFFKLKSLKAKLLGGKGGGLAPSQSEELARNLKVSQRTVAEMDQLISQPARSLDAPVAAGALTTLGESLADDRPDPESVAAHRQELAQRKAALAQSWPSLSEREQEILAGRALRERPLRLEDLAVRFGISRERVRQIEAEALRKLRRLMVPSGGAGLATT